MNFTPLFVFLFVSQASYAINFYPNNNNPESDKIKINEVIDENLAKIGAIVRRTGYDPINVQNISTTMYIIFTNVLVNLTNGVLSGGSALERAGDFYLTFHPHTVRVHGSVRFAEIKGKFNYSYDAYYYWDNGIADVTIKNVTANMSTDFDLFRLEVINPHVKIEDYGRLELEMKSPAILNPVTSFLSRVGANSSYKQKILDLAGDVALDTTKEALVKLNKRIPQLMADATYKIWSNIWNGKFSQQIQNYFDKKYANKTNNKKVSKNYISI